MSHSSYWLNPSQATDSSMLSTDRMARLASIRRAIGNFVHILTRNNDINVRFSSGEESYTDGTTVTISATDDETKFDYMVGLALHEGAHCLLSDFGFLNAVSEDYRFFGALHPDIRKYIYPSTIRGIEVIQAVKECIFDLMNIIEDRRIDTFVYDRAPGYRPYYEAMYQEVFFNQKVEVAFRTDPSLRVPTVQNYRDWLLVSYSDFFDPDALPGLKEMVELIDIRYIREFDEPKMPEPKEWVHSKEMIPDPFINGYMKPYQYEQFPKLWKVSNELLVLILKYTEKFNTTTGEMSFGEGSPSFKVEPLPKDGLGYDQYKLPNLDSRNQNNIREIIEVIRKAVKGKADKKTLSSTLQNQLRVFEESSTEQVEVNDATFGKVPCLVVKKMTKEVVLSSWFPFHDDDGGQSGYSVSAVAEGIRMGSMLVNKLQVRNESRETIYNRKTKGYIDRRLLAQLGTDNTSVFLRKTVDTYEPVLLYFTLDSSESMYGSKWHNTLSLAIAVAYAATKIQSLEVVITLRGCSRLDGKPVVVVAFDSRKDKFHTITSLFPYLEPNGSTPEGLCFAATHKLIEECAKTHKTYMVNVSDGAPMASIFLGGNKNVFYGGDAAIEQTRREVVRLTTEGIKILSYFVHDEFEKKQKTLRNDFKKMYGPTATFIEPTQVNEVATTLNKLLLTKE